MMHAGEFLVDPRIDQLSAENALVSIVTLNLKITGSDEVRLDEFRMMKAKFFKMKLMSMLINNRSGKLNMDIS